MKPKPTKKIPPSERIRKEIEELLQWDEGDNLLGRVLHKGMRLIVQELYEAEATDFLDRGHYERCGERTFRYQHLLLFAPLCSSLQKGCRIC